MIRSDGTRIGMGGTLAALGGAGVVALLIYWADGRVDHQPSAWGQGWFQGVFAFSALLGLAGAYVLVAVWVRLPLPATRLERDLQPRLERMTADVTRREGDQLFIRIGAFNAGRANIDGAMLNVLVPDYFTELDRCSEHGEVGRDEHKGATSHTPESLLERQPEVGSIYWNGNVSFPGRMSRVIYYRAVMATEVETFPLRLKVFASELDRLPNERFVLDVPKGSARGGG